MSERLKLLSKQNKTGTPRTVSAPPHGSLKHGFGVWACGHRPPGTSADNRKELITKQALFVTDQQYLLKNLFNLSGVAADKIGDGRKVRNAVARQRFDNDVCLAAPLNLSA